MEGRDFTAGDGPDGPFVAIVNESWVRARLGGREAVGQLLRFTDDEERMVTVVGVVEDVIQDRAQDGRLPAVYVPYTQTEWPFVQVVARLDQPTATVVPELRRALAGFNPYVPPRDVRMMDQRMAATRSDPRFQTLLISAFAALALLLASAGLYGSLSHAVSRRRREMGIRVALGAARRGLVALVVAARAAPVGHRAGPGADRRGFRDPTAGALPVRRHPAGPLHLPLGSDGPGGRGGAGVLRARAPRHRGGPGGGAERGVARYSSGFGGPPSKRKRTFVPAGSSATMNMAGSPVSIPPRESRASAMGIR